VEDAMSEEKLPNIHISKQAVDLIADKPRFENIFHISKKPHFEDDELYIPAARIRELIVELRSVTGCTAEHCKSDDCDRCVCRGADELETLIAEEDS
jgi:hypothetical protein